MGYRATPAWRGQYLPWGKGPTNYAPLPRPFTMKLPKGMGAAVNVLGVDVGNRDVNQNTGDILCADGSSCGNCANVWDWLWNSNCWASSAAQWAQMAQLPAPALAYVPPSAPSNTTAAAAIDTGTESDLIESLIAGSTSATQAANLQAAQSIPNNPISLCDAASDPLGCPFGMSTYLLAGIAAAVLAFVYVAKR